MKATHYLLVGSRDFDPRVLHYSNQHDLMFEIRQRLPEEVRKDFPLSMDHAEMNSHLCRHPNPWFIRHCMQNYFAWGEVRTQEELPR